MCGVVRVTQHMGLGVEGTVADDLQEQLLVMTERQAGCGMTPVVEH